MGRDKALVRVGGRPMATIVAAALADAGCDPVIIVGGHEETLRPLGLRHIGDLEPGTGPLGGVVSALEWSVSAGNATGWMLVGPCDLAMLHGDALTPLVEAARLAEASDVDVVVAHTDRLEPALAVWRVRAHDAVRAFHADGVRSLHRAIAELAHIEVAVDPTALRNINTPSDLPGYPGAP